MLQRPASSLSFTQLEQTREIDSYWENTNESHIVSNEFLLSNSRISRASDFESYSVFGGYWYNYEYCGIVEEEESEATKANDVSHFFSEILSLYSDVANSPFSQSQQQKMNLVLKIQEAFWRKKKRAEQGIKPKDAPPKPLGMLGAPPVQTPFDFTYVSSFRGGSASPQRPRKLSGETPKEPKPDPKKQTLETMYDLLKKTTSQRQLERNMQTIFGLFSDLPPYSLFHEKEEVLDNFEDLLLAFLRTEGKEKKGETDPHLYKQADALLLILALMEGSIKTCVHSLSRMLTAEGLDKGAKSKQVDDKKGKSKEKKKSGLPGVVPYLKQLEDYRKHKEACSLFDVAYQGSFKYLYRESSYGLFSSYANQNIGSAGALTTDGQFIYLVNREGLLKIGSGFGGTIRGHVYKFRDQFSFSGKCWIACVANVLYFREVKTPLPFLKTMSCDTLEDTGQVKLSTSGGALKKLMNETCYIPLISDGTLLYLVAQQMVSSAEECKVYTYDPYQSFKCVSVTKLGAPHTLTGQHTGVVCNECQRFSFRGKCYRSPLARDYNLCRTCNQICLVPEQYKKDGILDLVTEPQPGAATSALTSQSMMSGSFFATGHQVGVLLPPGVPPNSIRRSKWMCRVFQQGRHMHDFMVENCNNGGSVCFDSVNNLLWTHSPETYSLMYWTHYGKNEPTFQPTDPMTVVTQHPLPQGKTNPQKALGYNKVAMILLANIHILSDRVCPVRRNQQGTKQPFAVERIGQSQELISTIFSIMDQLFCSVSPDNSSGLCLKARDISQTIFVLKSILRITATNLHHLSGYIDKEGEDVASACGMIIFDLKDLLLRLATEELSFVLLGGDEGEVMSLESQEDNGKIIREEARRCICLGVGIFYPTTQKKIQFLMELLSKEESLCRPQLKSEEVDDKSLPGVKLLFKDVLEIFSKDCELAEKLFSRIWNEKMEEEDDEEEMETEGKDKGKEILDQKEPTVEEQETERAETESFVKNLIDYSCQEILRIEEGLKKEKGKEKETDDKIDEQEKFGIINAMNDVLLSIQRNLLSYLTNANKTKLHISADEEKDKNILRLLRFTDLLVGKSSGFVKMFLSQSDLDSGLDVVQQKMDLLEKSIVGKVLPSLVLSLCNFCNNLEFGSTLSKFIAVIQEIDGIIITVGELYNKPVIGLQHLAWFFDLEKSLGTLCGSISGTLTTGVGVSGKEKSYISLISSKLLSGGLSEVFAQFDGGEEPDKMDVCKEDFFYSLVEGGSEETKPLADWIDSSGPSLPFPEVTLKNIQSCVRSVVAVLVKHNAVIDEVKQFCCQLQADPNAEAPLCLQSIVTEVNALKLWIMKEKQTVMNLAIKKQEEWEEQQKKVEEQNKVPSGGMVKEEDSRLTQLKRRIVARENLSLRYTDWDVSSSDDDLGELESMLSATKSKLMEAVEPQDPKPNRVEVPTGEEIYDSIAEKLLASATFLLKFEPARIIPNTCDEGVCLEKKLTKNIVNFLQDLHPRDELDDMIENRNARAHSRAKGLKAFHTLLQSIQSVPVKQEALKYLGKSLRNTGHHYLDGLDGCCHSHIVEIKSIFSDIFVFLLSLLETTKTERSEEELLEECNLKILVIGALCYDYTIHDHHLFTTKNGLFPVLNRISASSIGCSTNEELVNREKKLVKVARHLLCLTATRCLEWVPDTSGQVVYASPFDSQIEYAEIIKLQDEVMKMMFGEFTQSSKDTSMGKTMTTMELRDDYHHSLLTLIYKLKKTESLRRYLSDPNNIMTLVSLIKQGLPRVQRLIVRLCKYALTFLSPQEFEKDDSQMDTDGSCKSIPSTLEFFFDILGHLLVGKYGSLFDLEEYQGIHETDVQPKQSVLIGPKKRTFTLIVHKPEGTTIQDLARLIPATLHTVDGTKVNAKEIITELKSMDQAIVVKNSTKDQCVEYGSLVASKGCCVTIAVEEDNSKKQDNETKSGRYFRSRLVDFSLCSEVIDLLAALLSCTEWGELVKKKIESCLLSLSSSTEFFSQWKDKKELTDISDEEMYALQSAFAAMAILGGHSDIPHIGGRVKRLGKDKETKYSYSIQGTVVKFLSDQIIKVLFQKQEGGVVEKTLSVDEVTPIPGTPLDPTLFPIDDKVLEVLEKFLEETSDLDSFKPSPSVILFARMRSSVVKMLERFFSSKQNVQNFIESIEGEEKSSIIPLLIKDITAEWRELGEETPEVPTEVEDSSSENFNRSMTKQELKRRSFYLQECVHRETSTLDEKEPMEVETTSSESTVDPTKKKKGKKRVVEVDDLPIVPFSSPSMCWDSKPGYSLMFLGMDRLRVQYCGSNGDILVSAYPVVMEDEFYFEVEILDDPTKSGVGVGVCPENHLPGWGDCFFEYRGNNGKKVAPRAKSDDETYYSCPYCDQENLSAVDLCHHTQRRHNGSTLPVVCPLCSNAAFGDSRYISSNFFGHMENSHSDFLYSSFVPSKGQEYGPTFHKGDIIGCGWAKKEEGVIYFTKNGKYLGPAFIQSEISEMFMVPMVRLRNAGVEVLANFGDSPFAFDLANLAAAGDSEAVQKLRIEQEERLLRIKEEEQTKIIERENQAELLMGFVGLPKEFCHYALIRNNDNIQEAASWAIDNFEAWTAEQAQNQVIQVQTDTREVKIVSSGIHYPGEAYTFNDDSVASLKPRFLSKSIIVSELKKGMKCTVLETAGALSVTQDRCGWVDAMRRTVGKTGVIKEIDVVSLVALLEFYDPERAMKEEWWFPMQSLELPQEDDFNERLESSELENKPNWLEGVCSSLVDTEKQLSSLYVRNSMISLLTHWPHACPLKFSSFGGVNGLLKVLRFIAKERLCETVPSVPFKDKHPFMDILWEKLRSICDMSQEGMQLEEKSGSDHVFEIFFDEICALLQDSAVYISQYSLEHESKHPETESSEYEICIKGATGLIITFDKHCKFANADSVTIFLDDSLSLPIRKYSGGQLSQFSPVILNSDRFWLEFKRNASKANNEPEWGYSIKVTPLTELLNLALWLSEFLIEETSEIQAAEDKGWVYGLRVRVYSQLVKFLDQSKCPETLASVILYLLRRILELTLQTYLNDPDTSHESKVNLLQLNEFVEASDRLHKHMLDLLSAVEIFHSTYLQNLTELICLKRKLEILAQKDFYETELYKYLSKKSGSIVNNTKKSRTRKRRKKGKQVMDFNAEIDITSCVSTTFRSIFYPFEIKPEETSDKGKEPMLVESFREEGKKLFEVVASLSEILDCFIHQLPFPDAFLMNINWDTAEIYDSYPASSRLNIIHKGKLASRTKAVFTEVFYRFGTEEYGYMSREELNRLQLHCHPNDPLTDEDLDFFFQKFNTTSNGKLTLKGFLDLYYREAYQHPGNLWKEMEKLGYSRETLSLNLYQGLKTWGDCGSGRWTGKMDRQLVDLVNDVSEISGVHPLKLSPAQVTLVTDLDREHYNLLATMPEIALALRYCCLREFNRLISKGLPFIDLTPASASDGLAKHICDLRGIIFYQVKVEFLDSILQRTATTKQPPSISIQRLGKVLIVSRDRNRYTSRWASRSGEKDSSKTVFEQAFKQLNHLDTSKLRQNVRAFKVTLKGERVEGEVGPYQETMSQLCSELQPEGSIEETTMMDPSPSLRSGNKSNKKNEKELKLFIPCPNRENNAGDNRDKYIINPSANSEKDLEMFEFVGKLIGISIRTKSILSLNMPTLFWKSLVGVPTTTKDIEAIDCHSISSLKEALEMDKETFSTSFFEDFTAILSNGESVELVPGGKERKVSYEDREEYVELYKNKRLHESDTQMKAIWKGIRALVPCPLLSLFTPQDLELRVCGRTEINLEVLKRNTRYRAGVKEDDKHVEYFWNVLEDFTQHERMLFLRFAWGRQRLPSETELKKEPMKIFPFPTDNPDVKLPHAETCFFNIKLPVYSSQKIAREKILYAITNTKTIDADVQEEIPLGGIPVGLGGMMGRGGRRPPRGVSYRGGFEDSSLFGFSGSPQGGFAPRGRPLSLAPPARGRGVPPPRRGAPPPVGSSPPAPPRPSSAASPPGAVRGRAAPRRSPGRGGRGSRGS